MKPFQALKIESLFDEEELKKIIRRRIKIPQEKTKNAKFKTQPTFFKSGTSYPSSFREKIYIQRGSSCNFQKTTKHSKEHNERLENEKEPKYLLPQEYRQENEFWSCGESEQDIFNRELEIYKRDHKGGRIPKFENSSWEAVINLNDTHTMADAQKVAEHIAKKWNFIATRIAIHRDEGHFETDENGEKCVVYNYHAHLNFITLKNARQNIRHEYIKRHEFSELQTEIAEMLQMERGECLKDLYGEHYHETKATKKHKSGRQYAQEQKALELTKKEIIAEWKKIHEESKGQGYSQEYFKALSNLRKNLLQEQSIKIHELNEILENFKRENEELKKENEALKKEKEAQAQKIAEQERKLKELEQENKQLKAELANNRTETALETQNAPLKNKIQDQEPKSSQNSLNELKTQETAPKAKSQEQKDLETLENLPRSIWEPENLSEFLAIARKYELDTIKNELDYLKTKRNEPKISEPSSFDILKLHLKELIAKEKAEKEKKDAELKKANEQQKEIERQTAQGNFNSNSTKSQSQGLGL